MDKNIHLKETKLSLIQDIKQRMADNVIEPSNAALLIKLISNADTMTEAYAIAELGTTYKKTGFHFDKRLEKRGTDIKFLKKNNQLSFSSSLEEGKHTHTHTHTHTQRERERILIS